MKNKNQSAVPQKIRILALLTALLLSFAAPAAAQTGEVATAEEMPVSLNQVQGPTDAAEMEAFMDDLLAHQNETISLKL
jgi:hypothetical protein